MTAARQIRQPSTPRSAGRVRRLLRGVGALGVLVAVVVGVPLLMGWLHLVPHSVPSLTEVVGDLRQRDDGQFVAAVLAAGVWLCWALFTVSLVPELAAVARKRPAMSLPGLGGFQRPAAGLIAAITIGFTIAPVIIGLPAAARATATAAPFSAAAPASFATSLSSVTSSPAAALAARPAPGSVTPASADARGDQPRGNQRRAMAAGVVAARSASAPAYVVQRRDTLWGIAERYLRDPLRYTEIIRLNPTLVGPDNDIVPGTALTLPADASGLTRTTTTVAPEREVSVRVAAGDDLYTIERRVSGDGDNWVQGFAANQGRVEPGGEHFTDPDLIKPGWTLNIPLSSPQANQGTTTTNQPPVHTAPPVRTPTAPPPTRSTPRPDPRITHRAQARPTQPTPTQVPATPVTPAASAPASAPVRPAEAPAATPAARSGESTALAFVGGGGLLLAGVWLTALMAYRRRQFQRRRPGRTISGGPPGLIGMERAVVAAGRVGVVNVTWLDEALRGLVQSVADQPGGRLPDVVAVRITDTELTLVLTGAAPAPAPAPWQVSADASRWTIQRSDTLPYEASRRESYFAPFPTLTSVGYTAAGEHWMLDLERIGALCVSGDEERCLNLARFLAAELAHNTWSEMLQVTLVGFGQELVPANPDRLTYTQDLDTATAAVSAHLQAVDTAMRTLDTDVLDGRLHDIAGDQWAPQVLLIAPHLGGQTAALDDLLAAMKRHRGRACTAVVLAGDADRADVARWQMSIDHAGTLRIPDLGLELVAQQVPAAEAEPLAQMLAWAAVSGDEAIPPARDDQPWDQYADACGGLTMTADQPNSDATDPTHDVHGAMDDGAVRTGDEDETGQPTPVATTAGERTGGAAAVPVLHLAGAEPQRRNCILPLAPQTYLDRAATTAADLRALAPVVNERMRDDVERSDPDLDADLAAWADTSSPRPKLQLLGPVRVWAQGTLPERSPQVAFHSEVVAYLASRAGGVLSTQYAETMWPADPDVIGKPKVRQSITAVRRWLGGDPTGQDYLPSGLYEASTARYRINNLLCDAHLFRRLRIRATARGAEGIGDLWRALNLVQGQPFADIPIRREDEKGPGGWLWLTEANERLDFEYQAMIVDTAHTVADRHLGDGEPELAARAAQVALRAGSYDDVPLLDLIAACLAQEQEAQAEAYVRQLLSNSNVEREVDLQPRTAEVLFRLRRRWRERAS